LRYIAVWYDEFLVPGENFNENIEKALRNGKLFIMAVTPNTVEDGNYIITTEYPMAISENKTIIPFEMIKTDRNELEKRFKNIPECVDGNDGKTVFDTIIKKLGEMPAKEKNAEQEYLLGRAYLSGIDVEVDTERGIKLLESAAARGSIRAACQLSFMYLTGNGVEYSLEKSSRWSEREIEILKDKYSETRELEEYLFFVDAYISCAGCITQHINNYEKARGLLFDAIKFITGYKERTKDEILCVKDIALCNQEIGKTYLREGNTEKATTYIDSAGDYFRKSIKKCFSEENYINLVKNMLLQIEIVKTEGKGEEYIKNCEDMLKSVEASVSLFSSMEMKQLYEEVYFNLVMLTDDEKFGEKRLEICKKWVKICRELAEESGYIVHKSNLVRALSGVGRRYYQAGKTEEGVMFFNELMILVNGIRANQLTDEIFREQAYACVFMVDYYMENNKEDKAMSYAVKGMESEMKVENLKKEDYHIRLALSEMLAKAYHEKKKYSEAKKYYLQSIELYEYLTDNDAEYGNDYEHLNEYGVTIDRLGEVYEEIGAKKDALSCYEKGMEVFRKCPDCLRKFKDIAVCAGKLYNIYAHNSDLNTAFGYSLMAKEYWEKAIAIEKEYKSLLALTYCNIVLLEFYTGAKKDLNDSIKAEECKKKLEELTEEIKKFN
ncbi:MAG: hypothetical protein Q4G23_11520, partial [Clostridia bacterium]|nr:hypothetical protein [Clostridia bacterium]